MEKRIPGFPVPIELENHQVIASKDPRILMEPELLGAAWILVGPGDVPPTQAAKKAWDRGQEVLREARPWTDGRNSLGELMFRGR